MDTFGCPYCADGPGNRADSLTSCCVAALRPLLFANFGNQPPYGEGRIRSNVSYADVEPETTPLSGIAYKFERLMN